MTMLHLAERTEQDHRMLWEAYPAWAQFSWLYLLSALTALRGSLLFRFGVDGCQMWIVGAGLLIACAAILRRWAHYELTGDELTVRNGYTGREIQSIPLHDVSDITVQQGIVAEFLGIGALVIHSRTTDRLLFLRGVVDPETMKDRIRASAWRSPRAASNSHPAPT
jgi:membrane protein YdbS with pleckstrin-like domain